MVAEITELWVENSQKINCRDVTSIREGRVICMTETTKSSMYRAVQVTKSEANKILEVFCLCQCQLFFLFIMYNGFIFDEKSVFCILTAFPSFTENVSINFEHKTFKSLIML